MPGAQAHPWHNLDVGRGGVPYVRVAERRGQIIAAARRALERDGVSRTTMRSVAAEAGIPLSNLHYAFQSKEQIFRAVLEDIITELSKSLELHAARGAGLAGTLRQGLVPAFGRGIRHPQRQLLQYELTTYALRTAGLVDLARWQYQQYCDIIADWCRQAAAEAGEVCAVDFDVLARLLVASMDGLVIQQLADPDEARAAADLDKVITAAIALADPRPAT
jgi:AcrR family transcriptional regulator